MKSFFLLLIVIILSISNVDENVLKGKVVSCIEKEKVFILEVLLDVESDKISSFLFLDKNDVKDLIEFVSIGDSLFQNLERPRFINVTKKSNKVNKSFKLPEPAKDNLINVSK